MSEPSYGDFIAYSHAFIMSVVLALRTARLLTPPEIGSACRKTAEGMEDSLSRSLLLQMAETLETAGIEGEPAPRWTPEVVPGGKNDDDTAG